VEKITLAIPTYNSSQYIQEAIQNALLDDFVSEILISDDCSNDSQYFSLKQIIEKNKNNKIKLIRTDVNIGGFENKYHIVNNSINEWIYLLDSDNHMSDNMLKLIQSIKNLNPNICYCPEKLMLHYDGQLPHQEVVYNFGFEYIGLNEIQILLKNNTKWIDWFLNTGNYFFNKNTYLKYLKGYFTDDIKNTFAGDVIAASYYWFKNGGKFKILKGFEYYHRLRKDSYWNSCGNKSQSSVDLHVNMILDL
jgi:glycosyltransferase involved in cell wall biosynthesis